MLASFSTTAGLSSPGPQITPPSTPLRRLPRAPGRGPPDQTSRTISSGQSVGCKDTPSCLLTNGRVLIAAGPVDGSGWLTPTCFHEFDGSSILRVSDPPNATGVPYIGRMLLLPTGQVLFAAQTNEVYVYTYFACPDFAWRPQITSAPSSVLPTLSYTLTGRLFNGMSQAVGYGDDASAATNYPLVRIRHLATGHVRYCRTSGHSTMAVATGAATVTTNFRIPGGIDGGPSELVVIANGIASQPVPLSVDLWNASFDHYEIWARLIGNLADGDLWVLGPHGPIPVDPLGPKYAKAAREARAKALEGLQALQKLGTAVFADRKKAALQVEVAPDEGSPEGEQMEEEAKERILEVPEEAQPVITAVPATVDRAGAAPASLESVHSGAHRVPGSGRGRTSIGLDRPVVVQVDVRARRYRPRDLLGAVYDHTLAGRDWRSSC